MSGFEQLLQTVEPNGHIVQLYKSDERVLASNVSHYLCEGYKRGDGLLVIADSNHTETFFKELRRLGADPEHAVRGRRLVFSDAGETLASFMVDGQPVWQLFASTIGTLMHQVEPRFGQTGLRAYGEMVGLLWIDGKREAAIQLERFWNRLLGSGGFQLYCAYPIDVFGEEFHTPAVNALLGAHTHLVSSSEDGDLSAALSRSIDEVFGSKGENLKAAMAHPPPARGGLPNGEAGILWLRNNLPEQADQVLTRARQHYRSEKRFRALVENGFDAVSLLDPNGKVLYASASTFKILGYHAEEVAGRNSMEFIHPDDAENAERTIRAALSKPRRPLKLELRIRRKDGEWRWVESIIANMLEEPELRAIVSNYRDISARKADEEEKRRSAEQLARTCDELQAFAYAAAHDLKEPLRTVCAFTQLLAQRTALDENSRELAGFIVDGVKRMSSLLDALLALTSLNFAEQRKRVELQHSAGEAIKNLEHAIEQSGATVTMDPLAAVSGIEPHVIEVFQNLIGNAIKYRGEAPLHIHISAERRGRDWMVRVKDNGVGIAPRYHDQIFGIFKRLHGQNVPGTGIGLAICKKIVEGMGGRIWVESAPGEGSAFCFSLPAAEFAGAPLAGDFAAAS